VKASILGLVALAADRNPHEATTWGASTMDFSNMSYNQLVSEKTRLEAELEAIRREQLRLDEIVRAQRKSIYERLPNLVGNRIQKIDGEFQLTHEDGFAWHLWVKLAEDILDADELAKLKPDLDDAGKA